MKMVRWQIVAWVALHAAGLVVCGVFGLYWKLYYTLVAALEGYTIARHGTPWSYIVWASTYSADRKVRLWAAVPVGAWALWFPANFLFHGWFPWPGLNAGIAIAFTIWFWSHVWGWRKKADG